MNYMTNLKRMAQTALFTSVVLQYACGAHNQVIAQAKQEKNLKINKRVPGILRVKVSSLRNDKGHVACALYDNEDNWPDKLKKARGYVFGKIKNGKATCMFKNLTEGNYAVILLHDEDKDAKMKFSALGLPKEGYAASNNAKDGVFSGPSYEDAVFKYDGLSSSIKIKMRYW